MLLVFVLAGFARTSPDPQTQREINPLPSDTTISASDNIKSTVDSVKSTLDSVTGAKTRRGTITPVDIDREKPPQPILHYYDKHGNALPEPVLFLADLDTVTNVRASSPFPLYSGIDIGVNFIDAVMMAAGQTHSSFDLWAQVSLHNWFFPVMEAGVGFGHNRPENGNFNYKAKPSPYFKIGINYNFLYKSNPAYQAFLGLRAGVSAFKWDVDDITVSNPYWQQTESYSITGQSAVAFYGEALGGLKVNLWKNIAMGWTIRYHFKFHTSQKVKAGDSRPGGVPWFIPGYGAGTPIGFTFSLIYTLPSRKAADTWERIREENKSSK